MSSSEINRACYAITAVGGIGAVTLPFNAVWGLTTLAFVVIGGLVVAPRWLWAGFALVFVALVLSEAATAPIITSIFCAAVLSTRQHLAPLGSTTLLGQTSSGATLTAIFASWLNYLNLEAAAPALMICLLALLIKPSHFRSIAAASVASCICVIIANSYASTPDLAMTAAAFPTLILTLHLAMERPAKTQPKPKAFWIACVLICSSWVFTIPRSPTDVYVLLPNASDSFAARFFANYLPALNFSGIAAKTADRLDDIPHGAMLLIPWMTDPLPGGDGDDQTVRSLARQREWTVVIGGEHTNLGGVADRVLRTAGRSMLSSDLLVPPGNSDESGMLRVASLLPWPGNSQLNRGASVRVSNFRDRVLLAGDGWWTEPDLQEWLWAGDYIWRAEERAGRVTIAASYDDGGARYIVVGDNSFLMNRQLLADPRPALRLLELATLWPVLVADAVLVLVAVGTILCVHWSVVLGATLATLIAAQSLTARESPAWRHIYAGENSYDEQNFNAALLRQPALLSSKWRLVRQPVFQGRVHLPQGDAVMFGLVARAAQIGDVYISNCRRLGNLPTKEGPLLMDAQACSVDGASGVLLGSKSGAASFRITHKGGTAIVILDRSFLAQKSPEANAEWLLKTIRQ